MIKSDFVMPIFFSLSGIGLMILILLFPSKDADVNKAILGVGASSFSGAIALSAPNLSKRD
jgi:preprotein translocase subunit SecG